MKKLAAFDVDGTLTFTDSFMLFLRFYAGRLGFFFNILRMVPNFLLYGIKIIDRDTTKNRLLSIFFKGRDYDDYKKRCHEFAQIIYPIIARDDGLAAVQSHLKIGDEVALVSASLYDYLAVWAEGLGVKHVLATHLENHFGTLTGRMEGVNCRGEEKLKNIRATFPNCELISAYGDSAGDKEMLAAAQTPFYRKLISEPRHAKQIRNQLYFGTLMEDKLKVEDKLKEL